MSERESLIPRHRDANEMTFMSSLKYTFASSKINWLLIFVPISFALSGASDSVVFSLNFIAIIPLAKLLGFVTEEISLRVGSVIGSLLNATFGNAVELILGMIALKEGLVRVVQASILGSILSNILLVLGCCFLFGGIGRTEQKYNSTAAQTSCSLLSLTALSLSIPAAFSATAASTIDVKTGIINLSHGTAIILLIVYVLYLVFQLKTHSELFEDEVSDEDEEPHTTLSFSIVALVAIALCIAGHAELLVGAIEGVVQVWGLSETFVGLIILPIVGNAAEHASSVTFALKDKMNLCIGIAVSSSLQIGLLVSPILVLTGWAIDVPMTFFFEIFETVILFSSVLVVNYLIADGKSNWLEGALLISCYAIVALAFFYHPVV